MVRGINKEAIFTRTKDKRVLRAILQDKLEEINVKVFGFAIMDNHLHFIIMAEINELSTFMSKVTISFALYYNQENERVGHVFQNRFRSECIDTKSYFFSCLRYIHLNPVKAGIVEAVNQYKYSSYNDYLNKTYEILHPNASRFLEANFQNINEFIEFHRAYDENLFLDVKEDSAIYKKEIAEHIISDIQFQLGFQDKIRIIQNINLKKELKNKIKKVLHVSSGEAEEIIQNIFKSC